MIIYEFNNNKLTLNDIEKINNNDIIYIIDKKYESMNELLQIKNIKSKKLYWYYTGELFDNKELINLFQRIYLKDNDLLEIFKRNYVDNMNKFDIIKIITFGTYDLFHRGHYNIFDRCSELSKHIVVGVSTDEFNLIKGKISVDSFEKRKENILKNKNVVSVFGEEKFELKDFYIKNSDCNLLIMGDDWKDKFNWVSIPDIYFPRTQGISSTMLKKQMGLL